MHVKKNVYDNLLGKMLAIKGKSKDIDNSRCDLKNLKIRSELRLYEEGNKLMRPQVEYTLTDDERCCFFFSRLNLYLFWKGLLVISRKM